MSSATLRRKRILKIRTVGRRMAEQRLGQSKTSLRHATSISERIAALRTAAAIPCGNFPGSAMQAKGEMLVRLDIAQTGIAASMTSLTAQCDHEHRLFVKARQNEKIAEKLVEAKEKLDRQQRERRQNSVRFFKLARNFTGVDA
ncbi:MAG: hypothetical protein IBJ12_07860 [Sphingomonadaceae bacterium]|nr:hypothetical protein [Sphingomonadaceae bacterium]